MPAIPEDCLEGLSNREKNVVMACLVEEREEFMGIVLQADKDALEVNTKERRVYDKDLQYEMLIFVCRQWEERLNFLIHPDIVKQAVKKLRNEFLIEEEEEELIDRYEEPYPEEKQPEGPQSPDSDLPPQIQPRTASDIDVIDRAVDKTIDVIDRADVTVPAQTEKEKEVMHEQVEGPERKRRRIILDSSSTSSEGESSDDARTTAQLDTLISTVGVGASSAAVPESPIDQTAFDAETERLLEERRNKEEADREAARGPGGFDPLFPGETPIIQPFPAPEQAEPAEQEVRGEYENEPAAEPAAEPQPQEHDGPQESTGSASMRPAAFWDSSTSRG